MIEKDDIEKRLNLVKRILSALVTKFPFQFNFILVTDTPSDDGLGKTSYISNIKNDKSATQLIAAANHVGESYFTQKRYHDMALEGTGIIVVCVDDSRISKRVKQIKKDSFYRVMDIRIVENEAFYELEGVDNEAVEDFMGYDSKRFKRLVSIHKQN